MIDLCLIGFSKCGSTSLRKWLAKQPEIDMFDGEASPFQVPNWGDINGRVEEHIYKETNNIIAIGSPVYSCLDTPNTAKALYEHNPNMKIIAMTRDRVFRAYSSWSMAYHTGREKRAFSEAIVYSIEEDMSDESFWDEQTWISHIYISGGRYNKIINDFYDYFPEHNIMTVSLENIDSEITEVRDWLGLPKLLKEIDFLWENKGFENPKFTKADYELINNYYESVGEQ